MHKIESVGRVVYAANLSLELLWLLEVDTQWSLQSRRALFDLYTQVRLWSFQHFLIKFIYSEKATKFCKIFTLILSYQK